MANYDAKSRGRHPESVRKPQTSFHRSLPNVPCQCGQLHATWWPPSLQSHKRLRSGASMTADQRLRTQRPARPGLPRNAIFLSCLSRLLCLLPARRAGEAHKAAAGPFTGRSCQACSRRRTWSSRAAAGGHDHGADHTGQGSGADPAARLGRPSWSACRADRPRRSASARPRGQLPQHLLIGRRQPRLFLVLAPRLVSHWCLLPLRSYTV